MKRSMSEFVVVSLLVGACGGEHATEDRDPTGGEAREIESAHPALRLLADVPTAQAHPIVFEPRTIAALGKDHWAVLDMSEPRIVVVDKSSAEVVGRFGRAGGGPGEIRGGWVALWADSEERLLVADPSNRRVSAFSASGQLLHEHSLADHEGVAAWMGVPESTDLYFQAWRMHPESQKMTHFLARIDALEGTLYAQRALPELPPLPRTGMPGTIRYFPRLLWTVMADGRVVVGRTDLGTFEIHAADGSHVSKMDLGMTARELTEVDRRLEIAAWYEATGSTREPTFHSHFSIANRMVAVNDTVFALQHTRTSRPQELEAPEEDVIAWSLVALDGEVLGRIDFPKYFVPHSSWGGRVVGIGRDEDGIAHLQEWEIVL